MSRGPPTLKGMATDDEPTPRVPWLPVDPAAQRPSPSAEPTLTPTKPVVPAWIRRDDVPNALEADTGELVAPVAPPPAAELLPTPTDVVLPVEDAPARQSPDSPLQRLGQSAVTAASLSAGGAPTPLGGVPTVPSDDSAEVPAFGDQGVVFTPLFADAAPATPAAPTNRERADALAAGIVAEESAWLASRAAPVEEGQVYTPRSPQPESQPQPGAEPQPAQETPAAAPRRKRLWWLWALIALVVVGAAVAAYLVANRPDPTIIPGVTITEQPPTPTLEPQPAPTGSAFQSAMPTEVGSFALAGSTVLDPAELALTAGRIADGVDLSYRSGEDTMKVRALQYYSDDDAKAMFSSLAGEDAATEPVEANGTTVGESAIVTAPQPGIVWRNGTSVFILTGPPLQLTGFFAQFGL